MTKIHILTICESPNSTKLFLSSSEINPRFAHKPTAGHTMLQLFNNHSKIETFKQVTKKAIHLPKILKTWLQSISALILLTNVLLKVAQNIEVHRKVHCLKQKRFFIFV